MASNTRRVHTHVDGERLGNLSTSPCNPVLFQQTIQYFEHRMNLSPDAQLYTVLHISFYDNI